MEKPFYTNKPTYNKRNISKKIQHKTKTNIEKKFTFLNNFNTNVFSFRFLNIYSAPIT